MEDLQFDETFNYLRTKNAIIPDGESDGQITYRLSPHIEKLIRDFHQQMTKIPNHPPNPLVGTLLLTVLCLEQEGFTLSDLTATVNVLKPFAEKMELQE